MFSPAELTLLIVLAVALFLILTNKLSSDLVALLVLLTLSFTQLVNPQQALAGFSSPVVVTIIALFIISNALEETGAVQWLARQIYTLGGGSERRQVGLFMLAGAVLSMVMNNVAAGAVMLPAAVRVSKLAKVPLSKILIPLSFGTLVGGMATYLTTANVLMDGLLRERNLPGLGFAEYMPTGFLIIGGGLIFMLFVGRKLLPNRQTMTEEVTQTDLKATYKLRERLWEVRILPEGKLAYKTLAESEIGEKLGLTVVAVWHGHRAIFNPPPDTVLNPEDFLLILGREQRVNTLIEWGTAFRTGSDPDHNFAVNLTEVVIPPRSAAIGQTLIGLRHRNKFGLTAVALWREGQSYRTDVGTFPLQVGDALLMVGPNSAVRKLAQEKDYLVLSQDNNGESEEALPNNTKLLTAVGITTLVMAVSILGLLPLPIVMLAGAVALLLTGCINTNTAYRAIDWRVVFLIVGMLPLSIALTETGLGARMANAIAGVLSPLGPLVTIGGLFVVAMLVTQVIGGQVTALVVGPVALSVAMAQGLDPQAVGVAVVAGCSAAFLTPVAHPVNVLMMGPAGYTSTDFLKVGTAMTVVTLIMLMVGMVVFWDVRL